jgi:DNA-binding transcriptional regulator YiaG
VPNIAQVLKQEIARISRKEAKAVAGPARKATVAFRKAVADLRRRIAIQDRETKQLEAMVKMAAAQPAAAPADAKADRSWITGKRIKSLRRKLGLSQAEFGKLAKVSEQGVYLWERKPGKLPLRAATKAALLPLRGLGAREARAMLADMKPKKAAKRAKAKRRGK